MAKEQIISIQTGQAVKNIAELRENIKKYKEQLESADLAAGDHKEILIKLQENQAALRNAMHATTASFTDITNAATAANVAFDDNNKLVAAETLTYNELVRELAILKQEWRATSDAGDRAKLAEQINAVNNQLKDMDKSVGVFGRNVGNYIGAVDHLTAGLSSMGHGAAGIVQPLKGVTMGLQTMSATPVVAILGLLANILAKVIGELKNTESGVESVTSVMGVFSGVADGVKAIFQGIGEAVGWVAKQFVNFLESMGLVNDRMRERQAIAQEEIRIAKMSRDAIKQNAEAERDIAELRAKAVDKEKYSTQERIAFLQEANEKQLEISQREQEAALAEYNLIKRKNEQVKSSAEELKLEAEAYARVVRAQTDYNNQLRKNTKEVNAIKREAAAEAAAEEKAREKAVRDELRAQQRMIEINKSAWEERLKIAVHGSEDEYTTRLAILEDEYLLEKKKAVADIEDADEKVKTLEVIEQKYYQRRLQLAEEFADAQQEQERLALENQMNSYEEGTFEYLAFQLQVKELALNQLHQAENESEAEFRARQLEAEKAFIEAKKAIWQKGIAIYQSVAAATSGILGSIADMYEADENASEDSVKAAKNLRIAGATIDMISGVVTAISQAQQLGPIAGPIMAAINSAAVIAAGVANISKIKAQKVSKDSASSQSATASAAVNAPSVTPTFDQVRTITGASEEERLNQMANPQKVYILSSDLEADRNQTKVEIEETTF